jgi:hypothetical protein
MHRRAGRSASLQRSCRAAIPRRSASLRRGLRVVHRVSRARTATGSNHRDPPPRLRSRPAASTSTASTRSPESAALVAQQQSGPALPLLVQLASARRLDRAAAGRWFRRGAAVSRWVPARRPLVEGPEDWRERLLGHESERAASLPGSADGGPKVRLSASSALLQNRSSGALACGAGSLRLGRAPCCARASAMAAAGRW